jgi:antitoxin ParD1/3/4
MKTFQVTLPDEVAAFVERILADKQWDALDDLVTAALVRLREDVEAGSGQSDDLKNAVRIGVEQADRGELSDGPAVLQRMREKLEAARKQPT